MKSIIVIPARLESTRLARKLLLAETGKPLLQHAWEAASTSKLADQVIVATDSAEIFSTVERFGGSAMMTSPDHPSGSDRIAEAAAAIDADIIVNLQGDEPEILGSTIDRLIERLTADSQIDVATLATPIRERELVFDPACVKVVLDLAGNALYFSRSPIPAVRDSRELERQFTGNPSAISPFLQHLGIYGFRRNILLSLPNLRASHLEKLESLEQLRFLANGWKIGVEIVDQVGAGIDTAEDYAAFVNRVRNS